jgi:hypothetical protein
MKKLAFITAFMLVTVLLYSQNVGIGTLTPMARLHVVDSSVVFSATGVFTDPVGDPPISGTGRRMMWYADLAAFRAGYVGNTGWDEGSVGYGSIAMGVNPIASGSSSVALGNNTSAIGHYSLAAGFYSTAVGQHSTASGYYATAGGYSSTALGHYTEASGWASTALGLSTTASGEYSTAMGNLSNATANYSMAIGESVTANSWSSISLGRHNDPIVSSPTSSWILTEPLFILGNGTGVSDKKNALVVLKNGNVGIGLSNPTRPLTFPAVTGLKISLYPGATGDYGFGVFSNELRIQTDYDGADITFGYDDFTLGFTERMRVKANGNVGIGTNNPNAKLDINGSLRFTNVDCINGICPPDGAIRLTQTCI